MSQVERESVPWRITREKIDEAVQRIVAVAGPTKVILFGSYVRGENHADSDLDLLIVKEKIDNRYEELKRLGRALRGLMLAVDLLVVEQGELDEWCEVPGSVYRSAVREGKVVYEAA